MVDTRLGGTLPAFLVQGIAAATFKSGAMPRIEGVSRSPDDDDINAELRRQEARYGAPLFNHTVLARRPQIFRGFRGMWNGLETSAGLAPALLSLINTQVAGLVGCGL